MKTEVKSPKQTMAVLGSVKNTEPKTSALAQIKSALSNIKLGIYLF